MRKPAMSRRLIGSTMMASTLVLALSACGVTGGASTAATDSEPLQNLQVMVPNAPGSGYDVTGRAAVRVMDEVGISTGTEVTNLAGAGGTIGLARTLTEKGNANFLLVMGLGVVGAAYTNEGDAKVADAEPIARLIEEAGAIFVPANSPYTTLDDLVTAWKANPANFAVGGGSSPGGPDHLLPMQLADAVGIEASTVNYVAYDGGGEMLPAILGGKLQFAASGYGEYLEQVKSGELRVLAVTSAKRVPVIDAPTLTEEGVDLVFTNWRGLLAAPGLTKAEKARLIGAVTAMHDSDEWAQVLEDNGWTDAFLTGTKFSTFLTEQDERVASTLTSLGLV
ncbi:tripartite tricarboxylate transporter substrate binding protein [Cryobacterium sp. TMT2-10]|uniref:Tripartite tricarboxylate transporter substrate binding protein n=2 Tax=Microbacteriaceae TaxID=85023 RepID=A0AAQ2C790_9MICO|nr:tripartite tricarboxylate transporter substrate binding protein [Cryobacterium shii]TFD16105.1 tripartite tricarboxylate transporter substrate binding protein [Cryobacterium sp. TMT2-23]TFD16179.1 tripartite tricarboxylate transporter substrate binding protein [Cryobacterium sp. TMT4-10]TFD37278.1 tripartite tricarboxylate transporter substrate binding protein [Cryobacterium sp. TMT2-10]